jgi:hypothetical protein
MTFARTTTARNDDNAIRARDNVIVDNELLFVQGRQLCIALARPV